MGAMMSAQTTLVVAGWNGVDGRECAQDVWLGRICAVIYKAEIVSRSETFEQGLFSPTDPCLSFGSTSLDIDPDLTILCGLGLLLLFLCYLVGFPSLPAFCKTKDIRKRQGRAKRRRKGGTSKASGQSQEEKERWNIESPLGRHDDTTRFRQLLCPDPFCEVCNNATAEVNWLLHPEALEDATSSASPLVSTSPVTLWHQGLFLLWILNSQWTIPHPNPLRFPLS
ncbi:hypothetical protein CB1_000512002 [Camelus ferus]|nr:hypothetical protein CB1_000512002 [Camelus ferus]